MAGKFTIGREASLRILTPDGGILRLATLTEFTFKEETAMLESSPLNGLTENETIPKAWSGTAVYDRGSPVLDDYFATRQQRFLNGLRSENLMIDRVVQERDGSESLYRFIGVTMTLDDGGTYRQDEKVTQRITWRATQQKKVN